MQRHLLADGNVAFAIGTRKDGVEKQYPFDIPLQDILDYVSPGELTRFETQEFLREDEKEEEERQLRLLRKPRGRPKKSLQALFNQASPRDVELETPRTGEKRGRGRPRKISGVVPSFNGPQPMPKTPMTGTETTPMRLSSETSSDESVALKQQQYSMVTASGLLPPYISEDDTSREVSMIRNQLPGIEPLAKRRKTALDSRHDSSPMSVPMTTPVVRIPPMPHTRGTFQEHHTPSKSMIVDLANETSESERVDTVKVQPKVSLDDSIPATSTDKEREALLRQFLTRDVRATSTGATSSTSSDSLMSRIIVAHRTPRQSRHSRPPNLAKATSNQPPTIATTKPAQRTITSPQDNRETYIARTKTPPNNFTYKRQSITPHFPQARPINRNKSTPSEPAPRAPTLSRSTLQSATTIRPPVKPTNPTNSMSSPPKRKQSRDTSKTTTRTSRFTIRPLEPTNDIRKFFKPKYKPVPSQECADSTEEDSEADGQEDGLSTRITGFLKPKYTPIKQESGSEYEDADEEEDSDDPITHNSSPPPQASEVLATRQDNSLKARRHQQAPSLKEEEDNDSDPNSPEPEPEPDPIDLIPRSTIPSPPAPRANPPPPNHHTVMDIESEESDSEQDEYLSAEEPELEPGINVSSVRDIHTGAELDADTEEDSEDEGAESAAEILVVGRGLGVGGLPDI